MKPFFILSCLLSVALGANLDLHSWKSKEKFFSQIAIPSGYNKDVRPPGVDAMDDPAKIQLTVYFGELGFCSKMQTFYVGGYLRQMWNDPRLSSLAGQVDNPAETTILQERDMFKNRRIWIPDTFLVGSKTALSPDFDPDTGSRSFLRVRANGDILASVRFRTQLACPVSKSQTEVTCNFPVESFAYQSDDVTYEWKGLDTTTSILVSEDAKTMLKNNGWEFEASEPKNVVASLPTGSYARASLSFTLKKVKDEI